MWRLGRYSVWTNAAGFAAFVAIASSYPAFIIPGYRNWETKIDQFAVYMLLFAIYGALGVSIAVMIGRIFRRQRQLSDDGLSETFD